MSVPHSVNCPVCACALAGPVEICTTCHTPHHQDCARFVGRCSVFGCGAYEFMSIDSQAAGFPVQATSLELSEAPEESGRIAVPAAAGSGAVATAAPPGRIGRSIPARMRAAGQLLVANPSISAPVGMLMLLFALVPLLIPAGSGLLMAILNAVGWLMGQALLVIMLVSRAQGKEATLSQALAVVNERSTRIILTGLGAYGMVGFAAVLGIALATAGFLTPSWGMVAAGSLITLLGFKKYVSWSLVSIVAAMGPDEEPRNALARSTELVCQARTQAALSVVAFFFGGVLLSAPLPLLLSCLVTAGVGLLSTAYWTLFYLEARRMQKASFLPYAPTGFLPEAKRDTVPAPEGARAGNG